MPLSRFLPLVPAGALIGVALAVAQSEAKTLFSANRLATGGAAWNHVGAIHLKGQIVTGGEPGSFDEVIDRRTGFSRTITVNGGLRDETGFDGAIWDKQNGIVTIADLPSLVADARTQAFALRDGWCTGAAGLGAVSQRQLDKRTFDVVTVTPADGSPVEAWMDHATHLIGRLIFATDAGPLTSVFSDWRNVQGVRLPFRRVDTDATGQVTITELREAQLEPELPSDALARPAPESHAVVAGGLDAAIPFQLTAFNRGHVVVPAEINGKPASVIFDSGGANYFGPDAARRLGLTAAGGINIGGVGTTSVTGGVATVRRISVGGAGLRNQSVIVGPLPYPALHPRKGLSVAGLIGFEFLSEYRTTFDYPHRTVSFSSFDAPPDCGGVTLPFLSDGHSIYVEAEIEGVKGLFRLDTGDGGSVTLFSTFAEQHHLFQQGGVAKLNAGGVGGSIATRRFEANTVGFAGQQFEHVPVELSATAAGAFASRSIAGNIGAALMSRFRVTFDNRARTVSFVAAPNVQRPFRHDLTGLSLTQEDRSALIVLSVVPGSPAAAAGIRPKDRVVSIEGRSVKADGLGMFDLAAPRLDSAPYKLGVMRGARSTSVTVRPRDYLHTPL